MLFPPASEKDPATWAAVAAGHAFVGIGLACLCLWFGWPVWSGPAAYMIGWEVIRQRVGAGWPDAITDAAFVALGACCGWALWRHDPATAGVSAAAVAAGVGAGVWRRL